MSTEKLSSSYFKKSKEEFEKALSHITTKSAAVIALTSTAIVAYYNREKISKGIGSLFGKKIEKLKNDHADTKKNMKNVDDNNTAENQEQSPCGNNLSDATTKGILSCLKGDYAFLGFTYGAGALALETTVLGIGLNSLWKGLKAAPGAITSVPGVVMYSAYSGAKGALSATKELFVGTVYFGTGVALKATEITHIYSKEIETSDTPLSGAEDEAPGDII